LSGLVTHFLSRTLINFSCSLIIIIIITLQCKGRYFSGNYEPLTHRCSAPKPIELPTNAAL